MLRWFARNDYAANFLMVAILCAGAYALFFNIPTEVTPSHRFPLISIRINLPGSTPKEVEQKILQPIENALKGLKGIKTISSEARRGSARIRLNIEESENIDKLRTEVESRINNINTFPREIEPPRIRIPDTSNWKEVISVVISGDLPEKELLKTAQVVRNDLTAIQGISKVDILAAKTKEISLEIDQQTLKDYGLTLSSVASSIRQNSMDLSAGSIKTEAARILLRSTNQALNPEAFKQIIITRSNGAEVRLGDIAQINDGFGEQHKVTRFNGKPCVIVEIKRLGDEKALKIADQVHAYVSEAQSVFPEGIQLSTWDDDSVSLRGRISTLFWNLLEGSVLVFLLLGIFLRLSLAFWVVVGIPVSFAGGLMMMPALDVTANVMSLFGFIIVLGIVVDDAIVTSEHIFSKLKKGMDPLEASVTGAKEVAVPVTFGVLTTIVAFIPLAFQTGWVGIFAKQIPYVVIPVLIFSLIESKFVLPSHLKHIKVNRTDRGILTIIQQSANRLLGNFIRKIYQPLLKISVRWRYATLSIFLAIGMTSYGVISSGYMGFEAVPSVDRYFIFARLSMMHGTSFDETSAKVEEITNAARQLRGQFTDGENGQSLIGNILSATGGWPSWEHANDTSGYVLVEILPPSKRKFPGPKNHEIAEAWRKLVGEIPEARSFNIRAERSGGKNMNERDDIEIELRGQNSKIMTATAKEIENVVKKTKGVLNTWTPIATPQKEFQIKLLPYGRDLGLTQANLARQVRNAFFGEQAQRIQRGEDNIKVMVRYPKKQRDSLYTLDNLEITLPNGSLTSLLSVAEIKKETSPPTIYRRDGARYYTISASPKNRSTDIAEIGKSITPKLNEITKANPGTSWQFRGHLAEDAENKQRFWVLAGILIFTLYTLLAIPFKSLTQPIFVLLAIPFGAIGAIIGHLLLGITPSWLSLFGMLALAGVVVNDSLVMVDFTNQKRRKGTPPYDSVIESGTARFRPILLTSLTTFAGLLPLIFERSIQAQFLIPMAVTLAFGIMFATAITLFLIPCAYMATEDLKNIFFKTLQWYTAPFSAKK